MIRKCSKFRNESILRPLGVQKELIRKRCFAFCSTFLMKRLYKLAQLNAETLTVD